MSDGAIAHDHAEARQKRAFEWARSVYGDRVRNHRYQAFRFLEEAVELVQTQGLSVEDCQRVVAYVMARKAGQTSIEVGDVRFTLDILAENLGISVDGCHATTINRVKGIPPEKAREKDDAKIASGLI